MKVKEFFSKNGPLSKAFDNYESREGQILLSERIDKILASGGIGVYEAGTGIGKSFAYLYPAYLRSIKTGTPVVISTTTNNLLSQLLYKDLPLLNKVLNNMEQNISYIGVKGKSHYACLAKMEVASDPSLSDIIEDVDHTHNGERSELGYEIYDEDWRRISYDRESCAGVKCPFYKDCYIVNLKKKTEKANIIVTNHNIIFAERLADFQILPDYNDLILDEGHNIESVATDYLTLTFSLNQLSAISKDLYSQEQGRFSGIAMMSKFVNYRDDLTSISHELLLEKNNLSDLIFTSYGTNSEFTVSKRDKFTEIFTPIKNLCKRIIDILSGIELENESQMLLITSALNSAVEINLWVNQIIDPSMIIWGKTKEDNIFFNITPLNIGKLLQEKLYKKLHSVVMVSATLTVNKNFEYIKSRLGLDHIKKNQDKVKEKRDEEIFIDLDIFDSPFDYASQMKVDIREDMPEQSSGEYLFKISNAISEACIKNRGNTFVLFTSYNTMMDVVQNVQFNLESQNINLLVQKSGNREEILKKFKIGGAALFGVESFWEGVDIPGKALTQVIIVKLPFRVPSTPIEKARAEEVERLGGNSFYNLSLPQAVIKFRQGIGRLIRTKKDKGKIVILDSRVIKSSYGKVFLNSITNV